MAKMKDYYVIPEHHFALSDDRSELVFEQHLPGVRREQLRVEVLERSICLEFQPDEGPMLSRCYGLPYHVLASEAEGTFTGGRLVVRARLKDVPVAGARLVIP